MAAKPGSAWGATAAAAAQRLGPDWIVAGRGGRSRLVRQPLRWWYPRVTMEAMRNGAGWLAAGYRPLTEPVRPTWMPFGMRQDEYNGHDRPADWIDPGTEEAVDVTHWWINGPTRQLIEGQSDADRILGCEQVWRENRSLRPFIWPMLAGFRVIDDSDDPLPVIDAVIEAIDDGLWVAGERPFWAEFHATWTQQGRWATLEFLDTRRRAGLAADGVPASAIADVLAELR